MEEKFIAVHVVPTGIGASIGGFVGDAVPANNLLASVCDNLIMHPNVVNGVALNLMRENCYYVEGFFLDSFFLEKIALRQVFSNKIGIVLDSGCKDKEALDLAMNTIDAIRTNKGIQVIDILETEKAVGGKSLRTKSGAFLGTVANAEAFIKPALKLKEKGASAIALATYITVEEKYLSLYFKGKGPNPYGGLEALISHATSFKTRLPCAHAPLVSTKEIKRFMFAGIVDPRAAAEAIGPAYLGCVLQGLRKAPQAIPKFKAEDTDIKLENISALVCPAEAMGGIPMLACEKKGIPIIGVKENKTVLKVSAKSLGLKNAVIVDNYLEAAGVLAALKEGIDIKSVRRPFPKLAFHKK
ncbi:MAG: DUF3326 domain-containing protein [Candidatus Diapherotrites archaeon]|nr:DUF3326 domain-containing protein [Candidatus Diapherotrites archaeon]